MVSIKYLETKEQKVPFKYGALWYAKVVESQKVNSLEDLVDRMTSMDTRFIAAIMRIAYDSACSDLKITPVSSNDLYFYSIIDEVGLMRIIGDISTAIADLTGVSSMDNEELTKMVEKATKKK